MATAWTFSGTTTLGIVAASNTEADIVLDPDREYTLTHTGIQSTTASTADTNTIFFKTSASVTLTYTAAQGAFALDENESCIVGPGLSQIFYRTAAGTPTFKVNGGPLLFGKW